MSKINREMEGAVGLKYEDIEIDTEVELNSNFDTFVDSTVLDEDQTDIEDVAGDDSASSDEEDLEEDIVCMAATKCVLKSGDHRKVVSHVFGRNKQCTRLLPEQAWILWCRKHYQRLRYRSEEEGTWNVRQLQLVRRQLDAFEDSSNIVSWNVSLRKKEQAVLDLENARIADGIIPPPASGPGPSAPGPTSSSSNDSGASQATAATSKLGSAPGNGANIKLEKEDEATKNHVTLSSSSNAIKNMVSEFGATTPHEGNVMFQPINKTSRNPNRATPTASSSLGRSSPKSATMTTSASTTRPNNHVSPTTPPVSTNPEPMVSKAVLAINYMESDALAGLFTDDEDHVKEEDSSTSPVIPPPVWERFLLPYLGAHKTSAEVHQLLNVIEAEFRTPAFRARKNKDKIFPGIEFLANVPRTKEKKGAVKTKVTKPAAPKKTPRANKRGAASTSKKAAGGGTVSAARRKNKTTTATPSRKRKAVDVHFPNLPMTPSRKRKAADAELPDLPTTPINSSAPAADRVFAPLKRRRTA